MKSNYYRLREAQSISLESAAAQVTLYSHSPTLFVLTEGSGIMNFDDLIPMISDITKYGEFNNNWSKSGYSLEEYKAIPIYNDDEFDKLALQILNSGMALIVDPKFGRNRELISGAVIGDTLIPISSTSS